MQTKLCKFCNEELPIECFNKNGFKNGKQCYRYSCKACKPWYELLYDSIYRNSKSKGKKLEITIRDLKSMYKTQKGKCYWWPCIDLQPESKCTLYQPSIDRLDNSKGYTLNNVVLCSRWANLGRNQATKEQYQELVDHIMTNK